MNQIRTFMKEIQKQKQGRLSVVKKNNNFVHVYKVYFLIGP